MGLRLVQNGEKAPQNSELRKALERVTRGSSAIGLSILDQHEAEALYRVLASRQFIQERLDVWIGQLRADHPYDRIRRGKDPSLWTTVKWIIFGGEPWLDLPVESAIDWAKRNERWVQEQIASVDQPTWLEQPLQVLDNVRYQITHETGKSEWHMPILRWALVQLLITPDVATGFDAQRG